MALGKYPSDQPPPWTTGNVTSFLPGGQEQAMRESVVYRCVAVYAGLVTQMPIVVKDGNDPKEDALLPLLNDTPSIRFNSPEFWEQMVRSILLRGDGFAQIVRRGKTRVPTALIPAHPDYVEIQTRPGSRLLFYRVTDPRGETEPRTIPMRDILHFKGFGWRGLAAHGEDYKSPSVLSAALDSVAFKNEMNRFASVQYRRGLMQSFVIKTKSMFADKAQLGQIKNFVRDSYGGTENSGMPLLVGQNDDVKPLTIAPKDAAMIELFDFRTTEIARAFGVPNALLNETPKAGQGKTTTELVRLFVRTTVAPLIRRMEAELNAKLPFTGKAEFDMSGVLRSDPQARAAVLSSALGGQPWMTINEARASEGLTSLDDDAYDMIQSMPGTKPEPGQQGADNGNNETSEPEDAGESDEGEGDRDDQSG